MDFVDLLMVVAVVLAIIYYGYRTKIYLISGIGVVGLIIGIFSYFDIDIDIPGFDFGGSSSSVEMKTTQKSATSSVAKSSVSKGGAAAGGAAAGGAAAGGAAVGDKADVDQLLKEYKLIEVYGGDLSGDRESMVVVDIGYGDREYYAITNEYGQLVNVIAEKIILQDDKNEPVLKSGRYYSDEAKVPGVESATLDEGHIIADSLGGVANAYNITPQDSKVNRYGAQADMEKAIREAGGCTNFSAVIVYPNTTTQIPSYYHYTYTIGDEVYKIDFENAS
ncbi:DNA/RNA non-specific endonuclease [Candidatus Epulonipiscium viviparus]|uniref:DNA/RNA non-specific endonuclease n=1 Tax=Candidatus Epulonipiscium viviparus TaxID=420336 RepID=UPI00273803EB|nr:DNA/RNA non-specific endonuclease [Candidatus Epulopiscium viviparus]